MAGYHCLMPTAFLLLQYTQHITANGIYSFQYNPNITAFHPIHHKPNIMPYGISSLWKNNMKKTDKNLSGKSDKREVKICKNDFSPFIFHSSFHYFSFNFFPSLRFRSVKGKLSPPQRLCFTA